MNNLTERVSESYVPRSDSVDHPLKVPGTVGFAEKGASRWIIVTDNYCEVQV